jgi:hypothetical protein
VRIGKLLLVPKIPLHHMLGVTAAPVAIAAKPHNIPGDARKAKNESPEA